MVLVSTVVLQSYFLPINKVIVSAPITGVEPLETTYKFLNHSAHLGELFQRLLIMLLSNAERTTT